MTCRVSRFPRMHRHGLGAIEERARDALRHGLNFPSDDLRRPEALLRLARRTAGYKSRISYSDAEYFNLSTKETRIAKATRPARVPTLEQI